jgi:CheY-like chemotaxis protein
MSTKTRVLNVRVVGFSAPERQMLNSIFLLSVAPARQIGYKLWNPEAGLAPDMYLLDGDSESAVASWQATFSSTSDRTLVVGSKNTDLGVASASRPLGLKVVGAMDRLGIALNNAARESALHDVSGPAAGGNLPTSAGEISSAQSRPAPSLPRVPSGMTSQQPALSASMNAMTPMSAGSHSMTAGTTMSGAGMTAAAPAATVLPSMTLQPNVVPSLDKSLNEKPVTERAVDKILSDKIVNDRPAPEPTASEKILASAAALMPSGVTPLSPSALSAAVAPTSSTRTNLRVVPNPSPLAASLPSTAAAAARIAEAPMVPPPGAPVTVTVPTIAMQPMAPPVPIAPVAPIAVPTPRHEEQQFRVLVVDDSPLMRTFLHNKLQPYGISPEFASTGEEALYKVSKQHFDMIFLDVMLPGMDGYDVCKMIKKNKDNSLMKVVMLTSKDKTFDKIRGTMAGCDGYLTKPVDELKLRAIIERHTVTRK